MTSVKPGYEEPIDDKLGKTLYYMEKLFPHFEGKFSVQDAVKQSNLPENEKVLARRLAGDIDQLMLHEKDYSELYPHANCWRKLTQKGRSLQDEIYQQLLFDELKQSPNYTYPMRHGMGVLLKGIDALKDKGIVIKETQSNNVKILRLNSDVTGASSVKEAIKILERKNMIPPATINYHHNETHGNGSHISGRDTIIGAPDKEQTEIAKQGLVVSKRTLFWAIISVIVAITLWILTNR